MPDRTPIAYGPMTGSVWDADVPQEGTIAIDEYPFQYFVEREAAQRLRDALGVGLRKGGAILVTGRRGSGKTSAVNKAIYDCSLLGRVMPRPRVFNVGPALNDNVVFAAFDRQIESRTATPSSEPLSLDTPRDWRPIVVIDVSINLSIPITPDALTRRIVRQLYWALVRAGVAGIVPELVAESRLACLRTVARFKDVESQSLKERFRNEFEISLSRKEGAAVTAGAAAQYELAIARQIALEYATSTKEEMDEELMRMLEQLDGTVYGASSGMFERLERLVEWFRGWLPRWHEKGVRFNLVFILDELDKLEFSHQMSAAPTEQ